MSWKLTLPCSKQEAETIAVAEIDGAALVATEEDEAAGRWRLDAYFEGEPDAETLAAVHALVPSAAADDARARPLPERDWVTLSQAGLEPVRAGRFVVVTQAHPAEPPPGGRAFRIEAGQAFGTGHHETTAGCLAMLDALAGEARFDNVIDLGTGTGLLAFAAQHLWPHAFVLGSDIDPVSIQVSAENAMTNGFAVGFDNRGIELIVADGARDPAITDRAPFDLVIANILAGPLIAMASEIAAIADAQAAIVLAGLLTSQAQAVTAAYRASGCELERRDERGDWAILLLRAAARSRAAAAPEEPWGGREGWATDGR